MQLSWRMSSQILKEITFEEMLDLHGYIVYTTKGNSMQPLIRANRDLVEIRKKPEGRCKKYQIILYKRYHQYILHRILKDENGIYIVAGDNNTFVETDVTDDMILGVVHHVVRDGKTINMDGFIYRLYTHLWCDIYPLRVICLIVKRRFISLILKVLSYIRGE